VAITDFTTLEIVPFVTRVQRKALEPDGIAVGKIISTGDGSGGSIVQTFRAPSSHVYVLKALGEEMDGGTLPGTSEIRFITAHLAESSSIAQVDFHTASGLSLSVTNRHIGNSITRVHDTIKNMVLGSGRRVAITANDIMVYRYATNTTGQTYTTTVAFYAYRVEAMTVPGFLENVLVPGTVR